jgi:hypothetical protein
MTWRHCQADTVYLAGDFNDWQLNTEMQVRGRLQKPSQDCPSHWVCTLWRSGVWWRSALRV